MAEEPDADVTNDEEETGSGNLLFKIDVDDDIPVFSSLKKLGGADYGDAAKFDTDELASIAKEATSLGMDSLAFMLDPLNFLISAGLSFLIDCVQPLEDVLGLVTGNSERMEGEIKKWKRVADALGPLAQEVKSVVDDGLAGWQGLAAEAARQRLNQFTQGIAGLEYDTRVVVVVLDLIKIVMDIAKEMVIAILSSLVEWLVITWVPALAAAGPTCGGSVAAAGEATTIEVGVTAGRLSIFIAKVLRVLRRIYEFLSSVMPRTMSRVTLEFSELKSAGAVVLNAQSSFFTGEGAAAAGVKGIPDLLGDIYSAGKAAPGRWGKSPNDTLDPGR